MDFFKWEINYAEFAAMMRKGGPDVGRSRKDNYNASLLDMLVEWKTHLYMLIEFFCTLGNEMVEEKS